MTEISAANPPRKASRFKWFARALAGDPVVLDVRLEKLVGEILELAEQVKR